MTEQLQACGAGTAPNPCFSEFFVNYLLKHVLPYTPLFTHVMFDVRGDTHCDDTSSAVEEFFNLTKTHHDLIDKKLSRFVVEDYAMLQGKVYLFYLFRV